MSEANKHLVLLALVENLQDEQIVRRNTRSDIAILIAKHIKQATNILESRQVDLIVSAAYLQDSDVFEFLKAVKAIRSCSTVPFLCFARKFGKLEESSKMDSIVSQALYLLGGSSYVSIQAPNDTNLRSEICRLLKVPDVCNSEVFVRKVTRTEIDQSGFSPSSAEICSTRKPERSDSESSSPGSPDSKQAGRSGSRLRRPGDWLTAG